MRFHRYDTLPSTMDKARIHALEGAEEGTVIVATLQTVGRGRRGRVWESPRGNLYMTYITYQNCALSQGALLSFVACVAVGEALRSFLPPGQSLLYKWPNDLILNGKKVGGILLETLSSDKHTTAYLIGCGINLVAYPSEAQYPATSFQEEGLYLNYEESLQKISLSLEHHTNLWKQEGFLSIHRAWMKFNMGLGSPLSCTLEGKQWQGISRGIDEEGALILLTPKGTVHLRAGDVIF